MKVVVGHQIVGVVVVILLIVASRQVGDVRRKFAVVVVLQIANVNEVGPIDLPPSFFQRIPLILLVISH